MNLMTWIWHSMCHSYSFWKCNLKGVTYWQGFFFYFGSHHGSLRLPNFGRIKVCFFLFAAGVWSMIIVFYILFAVSFMVLVIAIWWWLMRKLGFKYIGCSFRDVQDLSVALAKCTRYNPPHMSSGLKFWDGIWTHALRSLQLWETKHP